LRPMKRGRTWKVLRLRWIEHLKRRLDTAEIASQLFTNENEHCWKDHINRGTAPPWQPAQHVSFKLKPWKKENTAERQRTRPKPPPADGQDPLGPVTPCGPKCTNDINDDRRGNRCTSGRFNH
jgi:hypothetical protein